jgi:hypothetical protein
MLNIKTINQHIKNLNSFGNGKAVLLTVITEIDSYMGDNPNDFQLHKNLLPVLKSLKEGKQIKGDLLALIGDFFKYARECSKIEWDKTNQEFILNHNKKSFKGYVSFASWLEKKPAPVQADKPVKSDKEKLIAYIERNGYTKELLAEVLKTL